MSGSSPVAPGEVVTSLGAEAGACSLPRPESFDGLDQIMDAVMDIASPT